MLICARFDTNMQGNCQVCNVTKNQLDDLEDHHVYTLKELKTLIRQARGQGLYPGWNLNEKGEVRPRKKAARIMEEDGTVLNASACAEAVTALGFQLADNETWLLPHFFCNIQVCLCTLKHLCALIDTNVLFQTPDDLLHQVYLGIWVHLLECVIVGYRDFLQQFWKEDRSGLKFPDSHCVSVMSRLGSRMDDFSSSHLGFKLPDKVKGFAALMMKKKIAKSSDTCFIEGRQHVMLMMVHLCTLLHCCAFQCTCQTRFPFVTYFLLPQVLPYAIKNIIYPEMQWISTLKVPKQMIDVEDPTPKYQRAIMQFIDYVWLLRRKTTTLSQCLELAIAGVEMKKTLMLIFPHKSGNAFSVYICTYVYTECVFCVQKNTCVLLLILLCFTGQISGWKVPKFHVTNHVPREILMFGSLEVTFQLFFM